MLDTSVIPDNWIDCRFAEAVLKAVKGETGIVQPSFVYLPGVQGGDVVQKSVEGLEYFSTNIELGVHVFMVLLTIVFRSGEGSSSWRTHWIRKEFARGGYP